MFEDWRTYLYAAGLDPDERMTEEGWTAMLYQAYLGGQRDAIAGDLAEEI